MMIRELARRPSLLICLALAGGLTAFEGPVGPLLAIAAWCLGGSWGWRACLTAAFILGLVLVPHEVGRIPYRAAFRGEAIVLSTPSLSADGQYCEVESGGRRFMLSAPTRPTLAAGDHLWLSGEVRPITDSMARLGSLRRQTALLRVEDRGIKVHRFGTAIFRLGVLWREDFARFAEARLGPDAAAATKALCFNMDSDLDEKTYENLQRTGTIHIISASGLHVLIFAAGLHFVLGFLPIPRGWQLAIVGLVLVVYAIGAGMRPPVVRSVAMAGILGMASYLRREPDLLSALGATAAGYLLWRPSAIFDLGFQLSFAAVAGLAMFLGMPQELSSRPLRRLLGEVWAVGRASVAATVATAPLTAYYFGTVSIVSVVANVLIAVALPPITLGAFLAHGISPVLPSLSAGISILVIEPLAGWVLFVVNSLGNLSFAAFQPAAFSAYWMLPYFGVVLLTWRPRVRPV
jgi:ComEC/Rec2-related protein